jgi:hypothetical protein
MYDMYDWYITPRILGAVKKILGAPLAGPILAVYDTSIIH